MDPQSTGDSGQKKHHVWPAAGSATNPVGNPIAIALRSGRVVLVFHYHPFICIRADCGGEGRGNGVVFSDDDGLTWTSTGCQKT
eukprot:6483469-Amphidinium_carterae.1